ncbi:MAG: lipid-A-disaccharide synthase [Alphaproteobacteria bacterium]|nr:lipid-A-disaccharide synthase [Alphaproteobacteria bacterium]
MSDGKPSPTILLTAVEPSADAIGADFMRAMRGSQPGARFIGCGGDAMAAQGLVSLFPTSELSVMGLTDVARIAWAAFARARDLAHLAAETRPDAAVLIDAWGFSRIVAARIRAQSPETTLVKLATPQVWASRPGRTETVVSLFDGALCLLPFEPAIFEAAGGRAAFIGNPNFAAAASAQADAAAFRARHGLSAGPVLAILPGSRRGEVKRLAAPFGEAAARLAGRVPGLKVIAPLAPSVADLARSEIAKWSVPVVTVGPDEKYDAFAASTAALAASGTVTTELAIHGAPTVAAYRVDPLTEAWARRVIICKYASIVNIAADAEIIPERLQGDCTGAALEAALLPFLEDGAVRARWRAEAGEVVRSLLAPGEGGLLPGEAAAAKVIEWAGL